MMIKLMADYCSTGLWDRSGRPFAAKSVPHISEELLQDIAKWNLEYEMKVDSDSFDLQDFSERGLQLAIRIRKEMPDTWVVFYFNEHKLLADDNEEFLMEIYPDDV